MSQGQLHRPQGQQQEEPIKYGDVFPVSGELAQKPIAPQDAALMQSVENQLLGQTQKGGAASVMQSASMMNENIGAVGHDDVTDEAGDQGVTVAATDVAGSRIISESVGGHVVGTFVQQLPGQGEGQGRQQGQGRLSTLSPSPAAPSQSPSPLLIIQESITIGEALEATALTAGDKPVDQSDAAAIQAAEVRATGTNVISPGGVAATAQHAATANARIVRDEDKTKLGDILSDATTKLPADKPVTRQDAEGVMSAELRNNPNLATHPGGVAASVVAAARINQSTN